MQFFRNWARATQSASGPRGTFEITSFGYSNQSVEDALRVAQERAAATAKAFANGDVQDGGYYADRPFREEIIEEFVEGERQTAVISRNRYGALVLNTPDVFFADIDKPPRKSANPLGAILKIFGIQSSNSGVGFEEELLQNIERHCAEDRSLGMRLYRTTKGYRLVVTNRTIPACDAQSMKLLNSLGADQLYVALCKSQDGYRARLTPKPWRCGLSRPPVEFPFLNEAAEAAYRAWEKKYQEVIAGYATCAFIGQFGNPTMDPIVDQVVRLHDHYVLNGDQPIA